MSWKVSLNHSTLVIIDESVKGLPKKDIIKQQHKNLSEYLKTPLNDNVVIHYTKDSHSFPYFTTKRSGSIFSVYFLTQDMKYAGVILLDFPVNVQVNKNQMPYKDSVFDGTEYSMLSTINDIPEKYI